MPRPDELQTALQTVQTLLEKVDDHGDETCAALVRNALRAMKRARAFQKQEVDALHRQTEAAIQAYAAFEAQGHRYETLFNFAGNALMVTDKSGSIREANSASAKLLDMPAALLLRKPLARFVNPTGRPEFRRRLVQLSRYGTTLSWLINMRRADGTCFAAEALAREDSSSGGAAHVILWQFHQLSDHLNGPQIESDRASTLVGGIRDYALFLLDLEGRISTWNPGAEQIFGYSEEEIVGQPFALLYVTEDRAHGHYKADMQAAASSGTHCDDRWHVRKDGRRVRCASTVAALTGPGQSLRGFTVVMHDVTAQWRTNEMQIEREEQLRLIFQATQMGHWDCDLQAGRVILSPEFNRVMGLPPDMQEAPRSRIQECIFPADRAAAIATFEAAIRDHRAYEAEYRVQPPGHDVRWVSVTGHVYYDPLGRPLRYVGVTRDITERKRTEEDVIRNRGLVEQGERHAAILQERNRMAREIHDTLAQGFTGIFVQLEAAEDALTTAPDEVHSHIARARDLALNSLAEARRSVHALRSQALEGRDLPGALQHLIDQTVDGDTSVTAALTVRGDPFPLAEAVEMNLMRIGQEALVNALRHSRASRISLLLTYRTDIVRLKIADNGVGFPVSEEHKVTSGGGMGLKGIAERAQEIQARATISSRPGKGTTVEVIVPTTRSGDDASKRRRRT